MKFKGTGIVWDADNSKVLVEFENGFVETTDERTISILKKNGFGELSGKEIEVQMNSNGTVPETLLTDDSSDVEAEETLEPSPRKLWQELKRKAVSLGIKVQGKTRDDLLKLISEKENVLDNIN